MIMVDWHRFKLLECQATTYDLFDYVETFEAGLSTAGVFILVDYVTQVAEAIWPEEHTHNGNVCICWKFSKLSHRCLHGEDYQQGTG